MSVENTKLYITLVLVGFALLELALGRFVHRKTSTFKDVVMDLGSALLVPLVIVQLILSLSPWIAERLVPHSQGWLAHWPAWAMFGVLLVADDLTQYLWHRASHTPLLYPLHRAHHSGGYMSVRIVYRNNLVYYLFMPGLWLSGVLVYWGFGAVYPVYLAAKMTVIIGAHSSVPWDAPLYRWRLTRPLMWVVERVISTPATHAAHHGLHAGDGVTHYKGNYGNFLFLWDVLFGTARITRRRPVEFGIENLPPMGLVEEFVWPQSMLRRR
ncbi:MAG: sterol desaturase family protein [Myxococcota bacterium]